MELEYQELKARWRDGQRERDLILRLMFLAWMHWADPPFVTGLGEDLEAEKLWRSAFNHLGGEASTDAEFLFVSGIMAHLFPYVLGDENEWEERGSRMIRQAMSVQPTALPLSTFDGRGAYGEYFAHQLRARLK